MLNRLVTLVDIGLHGSFDTSMQYVQATLSNVNAGFEDPVIDVDFVRSREMQAVAYAFTSSCTVLHVMAHGDHSERPTFSSEDGKHEFSLERVSAVTQEHPRGIVAGTVIADACKTGTGVWQRAIRDCLEQPITYIGTSTLVGWHEATVYMSAFYGALTRNKGRGKTPAEQGFDAAERAKKAYEVALDKKCPYKHVTLEPSRAAKRAFDL